MPGPFDKLKSSLNDLIFEEGEEQILEKQTEPELKSTNQYQEQKISEEFNSRHEERFKDREPEVQETIDIDTSLLEDVPVTEVKPVGTSIITESTVLTGNMKTESHVRVEGTIHGNVETKANITIVGGKVVGNVKGGMVGTKAAVIKGDIASSEIVEILEESFIEGNIMGDKIFIAGHVIGNINSTGTLSLSNAAVIEGDIITKRLRIDEDALINGKITMNR